MVMPDSVIEQLLREELRRHGQRWAKEYESLSDDKRQELLGKMTARRLIADVRDRAAQQRDEPVEREYGGSVGTLQHGTGGGHRVIRSSNTFS